MKRKGMGKGTGKGYKNMVGKDPMVHSDSAKGRKQPQKVKALDKSYRELKKAVKDITDTKILPDLAPFYENLWEKNKGIFYRGQSKSGEGLGFGVMGKGMYVTWKEGQAKAFARINEMQTGKPTEVIEVQLSKDLKLLDKQSKTFIDIKKKLGVGVFEEVGDPVFASILTEEIKKLGYDGVISDDQADGIVVFDKK